MSIQPAQYIELLGQLSVMAIIYAIFKVVPNEITVDIYKILRQAIYRTPEEKLDLANKKSDVLKNNAEVPKECLNVGVAPADIVPPGTTVETLPQAFQVVGPSKIANTIEEQKEGIINCSPCIKYNKVVLLLRQEGLLTNKRDNKELASLLEIIIAKATQGH